MVMPVSSGTGASRLADMLDYDLIRAHPKLFTGFSDPSVLNNAILAVAGLPSVHGVSGFQFFGWPDVDEQTETNFWGVVSGPIAGQEVTGGGQSRSSPESHSVASNARSSSRSAAGSSSTCAANPRSRVPGRSPSRLTTDDRHLTYRPSTPTKLRRRSAASALLNGGSL